MRKNVFGRQFKRDKNERQSLFKSLISSLILNERIKTTEDKAKSIKGEVDKIITKAKKEERQARYLLQRQLPKRAIEKVVLEIAPRFSKRQGGYTRIIRIGRRLSDNASMVMMEWVASPASPASQRGVLRGGQNSELEKTEKVDEKKSQKKVEKKIEEKSPKMVKKSGTKEIETKK